MFRALVTITGGILMVVIFDGLFAKILGIVTCGVGARWMILSMPTDKPVAGWLV